MTIRQLDPADAVAMGQWYELVVAVTQYDVPDFPTPSRRAHLARFEDPTLLAWDGDRVIGAASYQLPQTENLRLMYLDLVVHPQYRRRGIGTELLEAAARVRRQEADELGRGYRSYSTAARHDATGQIVARTKLSFESDDDTHARQRITIVEPAHRGRRLGLLVKSANHTYTQANEPALRFVDAWNAEDNTHMRAVNAVLGFEPVDGWAVFQLPVPAASVDCQRLVSARLYRP
ncbi:GNAT family N-acetyltransferase [Kribbella sp. NPDC000426]|uniref:GNAT family N-acetyltransferase n=1 Tax=Kribbella sp. NPDC000426 TaxID=3154255 RepID=UPI003322D277